MSIGEQEERAWYKAGKIDKEREGHGYYSIFFLFIS
jgi:hypothetical protein